MSKIFLVAKREFSVRVHKKSFFVLTLLAPVLLALLATMPIIVMSLKSSDVNVVAVVDDARSFDTVLVSDQTLRFVMLKEDANVADLRQNFDALGYYALLHIGALNDAGEPQMLKFYSTKQVSLEVQQKVSGMLSREVEQRKLHAYNIPQLEQIMQDVRVKLHTNTVKWGDNGAEQNTHAGIAMGISYAFAFLIYMFIFMFGSMVMRGVIEEKVNRIVEVIVSSVKPFELMMGKILGVAAVGLLQFALWIVLTLLLVSVLGVFFSLSGLAGGAESLAMPGLSAGNLPVPNLPNGGELHLLSYLSGFNFAWIITCFVLFFLGGYLLYSSLFAAVGSAVEAESDTQQLMMPITIPLILAIFVMLNTFQYPDSALSFWFSIIPFTSPVVMMARIPFDVPAWQVALSLGLLYATFVGIVWVSGRIYRVGILMYGKKPSFKEMWKWIRYK
ncbi:MAG: ABC transporter permease [Prevotellaceae bacterium]|jgi:ABC-2 type transport system permease protein|nr:ABC transporter permease [Prevotellaceae bacterium]